METKLLISAIILSATLACQDDPMQKAEKVLTQIEIGKAGSQDPVVQGLIESYTPEYFIKATRPESDELSREEAAKLEFTKVKCYQLDADAFVDDILNEPRVMDYAYPAKDIALVYGRQNGKIILFEEMYLKNGKWYKDYPHFPLRSLPDLNQRIKEADSDEYYLLNLIGKWYLVYQQDGETLFQSCYTHLSCIKENQMRHLIVNWKNLAEENQATFREWEKRAKEAASRGSAIERSSQPGLSHIQSIPVKEDRQQRRQHANRQRHTAGQRTTQPLPGFFLYLAPAPAHFRGSSAPVPVFI